MSQPNETVYRVQGMTCGHCELSVQEELEELDEVQSATADRTTGQVTVVGDVAADRVRDAIASAGYALAP